MPIINDEPAKRFSDVENKPRMADGGAGRLEGTDGTERQAETGTADGGARMHELHAHHSTDADLQELSDEQHMQQTYSSEEQSGKDRLENTSESFDEQREQYTEKPANSYNYEVNIDIPRARDEFRRIPSGNGGRGHGEKSAEFSFEKEISEKDIPKDMKMPPWALKQINDTKKRARKLDSLRHSNDETLMKLKKRLPKKLVPKGQSTPERIKNRAAGNMEKEPLTEREYGKSRRKEARREARNERAYNSAKKAGRLMFSDENTADDDSSADMKRLAHRAAGAAKRTVKKDIRSITDKGSTYKRLQLNDRRDRLLNQSGERLKHDHSMVLGVTREANEKLKLNVSKNNPADTKTMTDENRRRQTRLRQRRRQQARRMIAQANFEINSGIMRQQHKLKKISKKEERIIRKRRTALITSIASLVLVAFAAIWITVLLLLMFFGMAAQIGTRTISQNDYHTLSDATEYLRKLETNVEEKVTTKRDELEKLIDDEYYAETGEHVDEFTYTLPDFSFSSVTLMAYLSAKFYEFDLDMVSPELDEIIELMYRLHWSFRKEDRTLYDAHNNPYTKTVTICDVVVDKTELEDIAEERLDGEALEQYEAYMLSGGGQQVYGPVFDGIDWSKKISSNFGERIHPITGERLFHDGVDIAVPVGTSLYSSVTGTVTAAGYSSSAGNMVTVRTDSGWEVTFMHMDSITVGTGERIIQGELVGYSGNTGNSTGPHLHIRVHDDSGNKINPVFIIPQNGHLIDDETGE